MQSSETIEAVGSEKQSISLHDRMKSYESETDTILPVGLPYIVRVDGRAFSKYTKKCKKPFDFNFIDVMNDVAANLCQSISGSLFCYTQSDEISILVFTKFPSEPWFGGRIQKICSNTAAIASAVFSMNSYKIWGGEQKIAFFDSRVFPIEKKEVNNYFVWRQKDAIRNSTQMFGISLFSQKQMHGKNSSDIKNMALDIGVDIDHQPPHLIKGRALVKTKMKFEKNGTEFFRDKWFVDNDVPIFHQEKDFINKYFEEMDI